MQGIDTTLVSGPYCGRSKSTNSVAGATMNPTQKSMHRRAFLRGSALAAAGLAAGRLPLEAATLGTTVAGEPYPTDPDEALTRLMDGNARFVAGTSTGMNRDMDRIRDLADGQSPFAAVLTCADSRVPPELFFDQGFGDIFTVRVAGNVAGTEEVASLEYTVGVLGSQLLMVLGHTACGAVAAAMGGGAVPGRISALYSHIIPATRGLDDVNEGVVANVRHQADILRTSSPVIYDAVKAGNLKVVGGVYDLATGRVNIVDEG